MNDYARILSPGRIKQSINNIDGFHLVVLLSNDQALKDTFDFVESLKRNGLYEKQNKMLCKKISDKIKRYEKDLYKEIGYENSEKLFNAADKMDEAICAQKEKIKRYFDEELKDEKNKDIIISAITAVFSSCIAYKNTVIIKDIYKINYQIGSIIHDGIMFKMFSETVERIARNILGRTLSVESFDAVSNIYNGIIKDYYFNPDLMREMKDCFK